MNEIRMPLVTVIAPCRNEAKFIRRTLISILEGDYPADKLELLVIDGMSTDDTRRIVQEMASNDNRIKLIDNPERIVPTAMNRGIRIAKGEYIVRIDCHALFEPDYIRKCVEVSQRTGADNVGGYWVTLPGANSKTARAIAAATSCMFGVGNAIFRLKGPEREVDTVPFGTYRKDVFEKIGLYDERLVRNQDIELNHRLRRAGGRVIISPEINLSYYNRSTFGGLWQQSFNNGLWNPYTIWLVGSGLSWRHFVPMFFVLGLIIMTAGSFLFRPVKWIMAGYIFIYLTTAFSFAVRIASQNKTSAFLILWSFIVLHIAYGCGSLWSIITIPFKFPDRRKKIINKPLADRKD
jgi:glycosyltransferase involved in cell wall biosynthesis